MSENQQNDAPQESAMAKALREAAEAAPESALTGQIASAASEQPAADSGSQPTDSDKGPAEVVGADGLTDAQRAQNAATLAKVKGTAPAAPATAEQAPAAPGPDSVEDALKDITKTDAEAAKATPGTEASSVKIDGTQPLDPALQEQIDNNPNNEAPETPAAIADAGVAGSNIGDTSDAPEGDESDVDPIPAEGDAPVAEVPQALAPALKGLVRPATSVHPDTVQGYSQPEWFETLNEQAKALKQALDAYMHNMRPKLPVTDDTVARQQATLARIFTQTINNLEGDDFNQVFSYILAQFHEQKDGVFHPLRVNRGAEVIALTPEDRRLFQRLVNLFGLLADPEGRPNAMKQVDLHKTLSGSITESGRQKVFQYFNV